MRDRAGRLWLLFLVLFIVGLSVWLWIRGRGISPQAEGTYLAYEASQILGCQPYVLGRDIRLDLNGNGVREYLISCDSSLSFEHVHFAIFEIHRKKVHVFMHFREGVWLVGEGPSVRGGHWVIDRREKVLMFVGEGDKYFRPVWKRKHGHIQLVEE